MESARLGLAIRKAGIRTGRRADNLADAPLRKGAMEDSGAISQSDAVQRVGKALYGKQWIGATSSREASLLSRYTRLCDEWELAAGDDPLRPEYRSMLNLDAKLGGEVARACDHHLAMVAQYNHAYRWLSDRGFDPYEPDAFERATFEAALARDLPSAAASVLKPAPEKEIHGAITSVYDGAQQRGDKPPNVRELPALVLPQLQAKGYTASGRQIKKLADAAEHKHRRGPIGKRLRSERRQG
jgi:hypothetical protein